MKNTHELAALAEMVRTIPREHFDMTYWLNECGTVGCAIGLGVTRGVLSGLKMVESARYRGTMVPHLDEKDNPKDLFSVVGRYFDISSDEAELLFGENAYDYAATREAVAARIESFIADHAPDTLVEVKPMLDLQPVAIG